MWLSRVARSAAPKASPAPFYRGGDGSGRGGGGRSAGSSGDYLADYELDETASPLASPAGPGPPGAAASPKRTSSPSIRSIRSVPDALSDTLLLDTPPPLVRVNFPDESPTRSTGGISGMGSRRTSRAHLAAYRGRRRSTRSMSAWSDISWRLDDR